MMFRDENDSVMNKAQKKYRELSEQRTQKGADKNTSQAAIFPTPKNDSWPQSTALVVARSDSPHRTYSMTWELVPSLETQALEFFAANYIVEPGIILRGHFQWIFELLGANQVDLALQSSFSAASLATLATTTKSQAIMERAQHQYVTALKCTNKALQDPNMATRDSTLVSVIFLGMYESCIYKKKSLHAWTEHVKGACTLLALRGKSQLRSDMGLKIFQQFYGTVLTICFENGVPLPSIIPELYEEMIAIGKHGILAKQWSTRLSRILHGSITISQDTASDPATMVLKAWQLEEDIISIMEHMPTLWKHKTVHLDRPAESVFGHFYHIYLDAFVPYILNNIRSTRIRLNTVLRMQIIKGMQASPPCFSTDEAENQLKYSERVIRCQIANICASMPQLSGQVAFPDLSKFGHSTSTAPMDFIDPLEDKFRIHPQGTFIQRASATGLDHVIPILYAIGRSDLGPPGLTQWTIDQLSFITFKIGMKQAAVLAEDLKQRLKRRTVSGMIEEVDSLCVPRFLDVSGP